jgi:hypothetical protein
MQLGRDHADNLLGAAARKPWSCNAHFIQRPFSSLLFAASYADYMQKSRLSMLRKVPESVLSPNTGIV